MPTNEIPLTVTHVMIAALNSYPRRARRHLAKKLVALVKSIQNMGLLVPILIDEKNIILSGHLRVEAYESLGYLSIPAIRVVGLSDDQKAAFVISANRLPELGTWDEGILKLEFQLLSDVTCDLDLEITGFELPEIDLILQTEDVAQDDEPEVPPPPKVAKTRPGDLFQMGDHRLICGDSLQPKTWSRLMRGETASACFADPPYNVKIKGHVSSKDHAEFAFASGEQSPEEFVSFLSGAFSLAVQFSRDGAVHFLCIDHRHLRELYAACDPIYSRQLNLCVWNKTNGGMGSFYRSRHELIAVYKVGAAPHINNIQLGRFGRNRSNVWTYPGANTFRRDRDKDLADHPTVKPVAMVADAIMDCTHPNDVVIDCFGGSGTMILAAERTGRRARMIEYEPLYCDVAIRRWEEMTGEKAVLLESGAPLLLPAPPKLLPPPANDGGADV